MNNDNFAKDVITPEDGIKKSTPLNERGLEQFSFVFEPLKTNVVNQPGSFYDNLCKLVAFDGSLIDSVLSMHWADYRDNSKKAKAHVGFDLNNQIPHKIYLDKRQLVRTPVC